MKLFYFLQELKGVQLGYDFRLFNYGPFDSEVLSDLSSACGHETVVEKIVLYGRGYGYDISPGANGEKVSRSLAESDANVAQKVDEVIQEFGSCSAGELELRSTILFVDREVIQTHTTEKGSDLAEKVRRIKPHFSEPMILSRITEMKARGWLQSL